MPTPFAHTIATALAGLSLVWPRPAAAQRSNLAPAALGQIVDVVLGALAAPDSSLSRVSVAKRKIYFDYERTIAAFERAGVWHASPSELHLRALVTPGTRALLDDCSQLRPEPCRRLGWSIYSWLEPLTVTDSVVVVRAHFTWPDRGSAPVREGVAPNGRAFLVGFSSEVYLVRDPDGVWRFSRVRKTIVSD
jgi:hypothetical protein